MPSVAILLATKNGEDYIRQQLLSYGSQTFGDWKLYVSDDGSSDRTISLILEFAREHGRAVVIRSGPRRGHSENFMSFICDLSIDADFFAFSDQDDIWEDDKLERSLDWLTRVSVETPAVYFTRTVLIDRDGHRLGLSPLFRRSPSFENALVQNIGGGNTMCFNRAARQLLIACGRRNPVSHDWWLYLVVTGAGGLARYDPTPSVKYRQHPGNVIGAGGGWLRRLARLRLLIGGRVRRWNAANLAALDAAASCLSRDSHQTIKLFSKARSAARPLSFFYLYKSGVYRQSWLEQFGLYVTALLGKL
jgi:glycosyltransferase involved in cell wall biosynthesis